jgi:hypothetical protein
MARPAAKTCKHGRPVCSDDACLVITDAAKRMAEAVGLACVFHAEEVMHNGWMAFALADGSTDHVIYPSKTAAIEHMSNEFLYAYLNTRKCIGGMPVKDAQLWLDLHRHIYDQGGQMTNPRDMIMPIARDQPITRPISGPDDPLLSRDFKNKLRRR